MGKKTDLHVELENRIMPTLVYEGVKDSVEQFERRYTKQRVKAI